jgi:hypothetical protein
MRFTCLYRSRLAKHDVIERLLKRQIHDGKWVCDADEREVGLAAIRQLRKIVNQGLPVHAALEQGAIDVTYDDQARCHVVTFPMVTH